MHKQEQPSTDFQRRRWRLMTGLLIVGCATTWLVAAVLVRSVMPILVRYPALSEFVDEVRGLVSAFGLTSALVGAVLALTVLRARQRLNRVSRGPVVSVAAQ